MSRKTFSVAAGAAALFLLLHLPYLPKSLEDVDSINFALGVRDFNVAHHQPHPPGYPVFMALAKGLHTARRCGRRSTCAGVGERLSGSALGRAGAPGLLRGHRRPAHPLPLDRAETQPASLWGHAACHQRAALLADGLASAL